MSLKKNPTLLRITAYFIFYAELCLTDQAVSALFILQAEQGLLQVKCAAEDTYRKRHALHFLLNP